MIAFTSPITVQKGSVAYTDNYERIVRSQIVDALTTNQGERLMRPDWGCNIRAMLFDPTSALERQDTASYIRDRLIHMVPRAIITGVSVSNSNGDPRSINFGENNVLYIDVHYKSSSYSPASSVTVGMDIASATTGTGASA